MIKYYKTTVTATLWIKEGMICKIKFPIMIDLKNNSEVQAFLIRIDIYSQS